MKSVANLKQVATGVQKLSQKKQARTSMGHVKHRRCSKPKAPEVLDANSGASERHSTVDHDGNRRADSRDQVRNTVTVAAEENFSFATA